MKSEAEMYIERLRNKVLDAIRNCHPPREIYALLAELRNLEGKDDA